MRVLATWNDPKTPRQTYVRVALAAAESSELLAGDVAELPGLGVRRLIRVRYTDSPEPGVLPGERVYALEVGLEVVTP